MGISKEVADILAETLARLPIQSNGHLWDEPSALMYGRQSVDGVQLTPEELFGQIGFARVDSLDISDHEGCSIVHDLNQPIPEHLSQSFNCIYDGGTLEHVFDVKTALFNSHNLLKGGGVIMHVVPMNNFINHGFYQFSPTLLLGFYQQNGYEVLRLIFSLSVKNAATAPGKFFEAAPGQMAALALSCRIVLPPSFSPQHMTTMVFVARKSASHAAPVIPQQPFFSDRYPDAEFGQLKNNILNMVG